MRLSFWWQIHIKLRSTSLTCKEWWELEKASDENAYYDWAVDVTFIFSVKCPYHMRPARSSRHALSSWCARPSTHTTPAPFGGAKGLKCSPQSESRLPHIVRNLKIFQCFVCVYCVQLALFCAGPEGPRFFCLSCVLWRFLFYTKPPILPCLLAGRLAAFWAVSFEVVAETAKLGIRPAWLATDRQH